MYLFFFYLEEYAGGAERRLCRIFNEISKGSNKFDILIIGRKEYIDKFVKSNIDNVEFNLIICKTTIEAIRYLLKKRYKTVCFYDARIRIMPILFLEKLLKARLLMVVAYTNFSMLKFNNFKERSAFYITSLLCNHVDCLYPSNILKKHSILRYKNVTVTPNSFTNLEKFKASDKRNLIVFSSRLVEGKNCDIALQSINECRKELEYNKFVVYICGEGIHRKDLEKYVNDKGLDNLVKFLGYIDTSEILSRTKIFLSLQTENNYPSQSLLEAISSGCYIIASNSGDTELIVKKEFGTILNLNYKDISNAIKEYLRKNDKEKEDIINNSRLFAEGNFDIKQSVRYFEELI